MPTLAMRVLLLVVLVSATMGCDRVTKHVAVSALFGAAPVSFLGDIVHFEYAENTGGFLGLGARLPDAVRRAVFTSATGLGLLAMAVMAVFLRQRWLAVAGLALLVAGGLSNWVDRLADGRVVDFMVVGIGPIRTGVFNVADVAVMLGAAGLLVAQLRRESAAAADVSSD